ncbi:PorV/PorQ family protein [bacterium]|nr:MAG: PorV/PorQ family protein [bacterium]
MLRFVILIIFIGFSSSYAGESGYQFLRVGVPAKATGLGDTYVSQFGDVNTFMYNPAGLSKLSHRQFSAGYMNHILDIGSGYAAYAQPYKDIGVFGAGLVYFGYGDFQGYDASGYETSSFSSSDYALSLFYARQLKENVHFGATVKIIRSAIENYSSGAVAVDLGAIYVLQQYDMQLGASLLNAGFATHAFLDHKEKLPLSLQLGVSRKWNFTTFGLNLSDLNLPGNRLKRFAVSAEADPWEKISMRIGYNLQRKSELDLKGSGFLNGAAGLSAGLGFKHQNYVFDYSFSSWGIGAVNRFSLTVNL